MRQGGGRREEEENSQSHKKYGHCPSDRKSERNSCTYLL